MSVALMSCACVYDVLALRILRRCDHGLFIALYDDIIALVKSNNYSAHVKFNDVTDVIASLTS